ncbi:ABC transporter permease [Sciscionella sediminilitoris]|uniref:ABC transporter permease n=1 Tax=Sciscionella sediminilitoris TaxID=1445613 RepID=UPI0004DF5C20|nr:ABC transporter permease [Sciscionella sp. SE31]
MTGYLVRRIAANLVVFVLITIAIFALVHNAPGDPIAMQIPPAQLNAGSAAFIATKRHELGLDLPLPVQYLRWVSGAVHGDLGYSLVNGRPVGELLAERIGPTLELTGIGLAIALLLAIPLGTLAALRRNTVLDHSVTVLSLGAVSIPPFFLAIVAIFLLSVQLPLLPSSGISTPGSGAGLGDLVWHLILPVLVLGLTNAGPYMRYVRSSVLGEIGADYVRTAAAKGTSPGRIARSHILRNAMLPVVTVVAANLPQQLAAAVVIEQVFAWPGLGQLALSSVQSHDYSVIIGFALVVAVFVLISNLVADLLYPLIDPRVRLT